MSRPVYLDEAGHERVSRAVYLAERHTSGEIVTIVADKSDSYGDVALGWAAAAALLALGALALAPEFFLARLDPLMGGWTQQWTPGRLVWLAALVAATKFLAVVLLQLWPPIKYALIPAALKTARVHARAIEYFRVGAERRTDGLTGVLIYLSMREHRAEIVADAAIASRVPDEVWGDAMAAMLIELKAGRVAEAMVSAVDKVGAVLAEHLPRTEEGDRNEIPDRLIEL